MLQRSIGSILALLVFCAPALAGFEVRLARHPAPSPDGALIAFSWQGDLWTVPSEGGDARRLTTHPGHEANPVWSRDGELIAFSSDRHGGDDVFVMPADGSEAPRRLTHAQWSDTPATFTPDGEAVVFTSRRDESIRRMPAIYSVPLEGGTPMLLQDALGRWPTFSPDGDELAFVRGGTYWWRQDYRGAANRELWRRTAGGEYEPLTRFDGDDDKPCWASDGSIVFLSSREGRKNVFRLDPASGEVEQLTTHRKTAARHPSCAFDAPLVAYEHEDQIWTITGDERPRRLRILAPADSRRDDLVRSVEQRGASDLAVSADGKTAAFVVDADVFVVGIAPKEDQEIAPPRTATVTETPGREADPSWSPDGASLIFTSDRAGQDDIWIATRPDDEVAWGETFEFEVKPLIDLDEPARSARFSPDGERVAFIRGSGDLVVAAADGSDAKTLVEHWFAPDYSWSPDGRYIAYSKIDAEFNSEVFIVPADGSAEPYNVSRHPDDDVSPAWSPDGRRLVWISKRHADTLDVWGVWLTRADDERTAEGWLKVFKAGAGGKKGKKKEEPKKDDEENESEKNGEDDEGDDEKKDEEDEKDEKKKDLPEVKIDFERLWERSVPLTALNGDESSPFVSKDGKTIFFTAAPDGERDLWKVRFDGTKPEKVTSGGKSPSDLQLSADGKTIFHLAQGGTIARLSAAGKPGDPIPFAARFERLMTERRAAVFDEAVRTISEWFYDPDMHGVDFADLAESYRGWALASSTQRDFGDVVNLLLGELNASHMGYRKIGGSDGESTGSIGALFDPSAGGPGLLVRDVLVDSPAARVDVNLEPGERLLAVDGEEIGPRTNVYALFAETAGLQTRLRILGTDGEEREAVVKPDPLGATRNQRYETWVRQRASMVDDLARGRLGYIHIQAMGMASFEDFERALHSAAHGKEGLVIDVRSNGGGWTTDYLMAVLNVRRHAYTISRGQDPDIKAYPQGRLPLAAWTRPIIVLCDEESYSNAEIFSWAIQTLGRGKVVGEQTFGAVISTGGTLLLDGNLLRLPFRGWYVAGSGVNMENNGATPDVRIPRPPREDTFAESDAQLERAVEVFLADIGNDPRHGSW